MTPPAGLAAIVRRIVALHDPDSIHLFGSYGKGTAGAGSDIDLLVVKPSDLPRHLRGRDVAAALAEFAFDFDLLFVTPDELAADLREEHSLLATIVPDAQQLYAR
jgi:uncharacterized protein